jgi:hypothetical protein
MAVKRLKYCVNNEWKEDNEVHAGDKLQHRRGNGGGPLLYGGRGQ